MEKLQIPMCITNVTCVRSDKGPLFSSVLLQKSFLYGTFSEEPSSSKDCVTAMQSIHNLHSRVEAEVEGFAVEKYFEGQHSFLIVSDSSQAEVLLQVAKRLLDKNLPLKIGLGSGVACEGIIGLNSCSYAVVGNVVNTLRKLTSASNSSLVATEEFLLDSGLLSSGDLRYYGSFEGSKIYTFKGAREVITQPIVLQEKGATTSLQNFQHVVGQVTVDQSFLILTLVMMASCFHSMTSIFDPALLWQFSIFMAAAGLLFLLILLPHIYIRNRTCLCVGFHILWMSGGIFSYMGQDFASNLSCSFAHVMGLSHAGVVLPIIFLSLGLRLPLKIHLPLNLLHIALAGLRVPETCRYSEARPLCFVWSGAVHAALGFGVPTGLIVWQARGRKGQSVGVFD